MMKLVDVSVRVTDQENLPVRGLDVAASPNVGWWNGAAQIYGANLVHGRELLKSRDYLKVMKASYPGMFRGLTDSQGKLKLQLPVGKQYLELVSDVYELPIHLGSRAMQPIVEQGKTLDIEITVHPLGTEKLGDWDKLAGVVYGCSTLEGRRILALPGMQEKMNAFVERFSKAKNLKDPKMLSEAYQILANAFLSIGDEAEALKWRRKANEAVRKGNRQ